VVGKFRNAYFFFYFKQTHSAVSFHRISYVLSRLSFRSFLDSYCDVSPIVAKRRHKRWGELGTILYIASYIVWIVPLHSRPHWLFSITHLENQCMEGAGVEHEITSNGHQRWSESFYWIYRVSVSQAYGVIPRWYLRERGDIEWGIRAE
jgi:hypothetical protein